MATAKKTRPENRFSEMFKHLKPRLLDKGWGIAHHSTTVVRGYPFHATIFQAPDWGQRYLCIHNPDGIATFEKLEPIAPQKDLNRSPLLHEILTECGF